MPRLTARAYIAALPAVLKQRMREEVYRHYVAEALRVVGENTARLLPSDGTYLKVRYAELIDPKPADPRTGEQIVDGIKSKLRQIGGAP